MQGACENRKKAYFRTRYVGVLWSFFLQHVGPWPVHLAISGQLESMRTKYRLYFMYGQTVRWLFTAMHGPLNISVFLQYSSVSWSTIASMFLQSYTSTFTHSSSVIAHTVHIHTSVFYALTAMHAHAPKQVWQYSREMSQARLPSVSGIGLQVLWVPTSCLKSSSSTKM